MSSNTAVSFLDPEPASQALDLAPTTVNKSIIEPYIKLMCHRKHGAVITEEALRQYELELLEVIEKVQNNDLSDMDAILSAQAISLNNSYTSFAMQADILIYEGHSDEADKLNDMALKCAEKSMRAIGQLNRNKKKPKATSKVYTRTMNQLNQQVNN